VAARALQRVIELEKETPLAGQAYLVLAQIHRRQGKTEQAARDMENYRKIQALAAHPPA
jgi:Tetratricopeptide repeat